MIQNNIMTIKYIEIGEILQGKTFKSFNSLRKRTNKIISPIREEWMTIVLTKNEVFINNDLMTRREVVEIFDKNKITMTNEEGRYRILKDGAVIGEWMNKRSVRITNEGKMQIKIKYLIV
jgi:hypothetical protein